MLSTKAAIVLNFCLNGKIPYDFPILRTIESARKTFVGIQVRVSVEWTALKLKLKFTFITELGIFLASRFRKYQSEDNFH